MRRFVCVLAACAMLGSIRAAGQEIDAGYRVAPFEAVVTIPVGHACMGGGIANAREVIDPLFAKGFVMLGGGGDKPVVLVSVDFCQLDNDAFDRWRDVLAEAAGTTRQRVLLSTVHQHDAPICDLRAQALLDAAGLKNAMCDPAFCEKAAQKTAAALRAALSRPRRVTHVGTGRATVEKLASNRRIAKPGEKVHWNRTSADKLYNDQPEGEVDPEVKTISLWDGDKPVLAWSTYAIHPMSSYGRGLVSADFVGRARARREADDLDVFQIYFSGCAGDTTAGKYNNGLPEEKAVLADRLYQGMAAAWRDTNRAPLARAEFRCATLKMAPRDDGDFAPDAMARILVDAKLGRWQRIRAAMGISWRERVLSGRTIDVPCVDFGVAQFAVMPAETFVGYQLAAQRWRPDSLVVVAGYGDGAPGYIPTAACWKDGYDDAYCWIKPESAPQMEAALAEAIGAKK